MFWLWWSNPQGGRLLQAMRLDLEMNTEPNPRASLDAAVAFCLYSGADGRRASEPEV